MQGIFWLSQTQPSKWGQLQAEWKVFAALSFLHFLTRANTGWANCKDHDIPGLGAVLLSLQWFLCTSFTCVLSVTGRTANQLIDKNPTMCVGDWPCTGNQGDSLTGACRNEEKEVQLLQSTQEKNLPSLHLKQTSGSTSGFTLCHFLWPLPTLPTLKYGFHLAIGVSPLQPPPEAVTPFCTDAIYRFSFYFSQVGWRWVRTCWFPGHALLHDLDLIGALYHDKDPTAPHWHSILNMCYFFFLYDPCHMMDKKWISQLEILQRMKFLHCCITKSDMGAHCNDHYNKGKVIVPSAFTQIFTTANLSTSVFYQNWRTEGITHSDCAEVGRSPSPRPL